MKLKTKRLILRKPRKSDVEDVCKNINNIKISKWLLVVPFPYNKKDAEWFINHCKSNLRKKEKDSYSFFIALKETKKVIGGIGLTSVKKDQGTASVGYWLGEEHWKKGYGSEALDALLKFAFNKLKLRRIEAGVFAGNPSSGKLLEKFGAKKEGVKRKGCVCKANGKIHDEVMYGLLKSEWRKLK